MSLETARKIAGHISIRMTRHYFHGDLGDMKHAVDALRKGATRFKSYACRA